jgi:small multidrug resistance family-3 protein
VRKSRIYDVFADSLKNPIFDLARARSMVEEYMRELALYFLMFGAALLELTGCNGFWNCLKEQRGLKWAFVGLLAFIAYGVLQTFQGLNFGRVYAVYGGVFVFCSLLWGWAKTNRPPDTGDLVGGMLCVSGSLLIRFWPGRV